MKLKYEFISTILYMGVINMTLQGRVLLNSSIRELTARRQLKDQMILAPSAEDGESSNGILDSETFTETPFRRPYLCLMERNAANQLPESALRDYFQLGEFIHIPMTREEKIIINQFKSFSKKKSLEPEDLEQIAQMLPGRRWDDLKNYFEDLNNNTLNDAILVFSGGIESVSPSLPAQKVRSDWSRILEKQFSIFESSGSITQIACRNGFGGINARTMIGACATQEERYNRVGEIVMAYREDSSNYGALILDGHKKAKASANGSIEMRQTVTSVVYDPLTDLFFSGGYDGDVVAWSAAKAIALDTIGSHPKLINSIACHSKQNLIAYGCQSGSVFYFNSFSELGSRRARSVSLFSKPKGKDSFSNTVDSVAIPATGLRENTCYAGIGFLQSCGAGIIEGWDLEAGVFSSSSEKLPSGLTCMSLSACGKWLAAGTGGIASDEIKGDGIVRVMDLNSDLKTAIAIKTKKYDLDCVSFCPRSSLLFMGETSDSSVSVYDLRFTAAPLFTTSHGTCDVDSIVAHAWLKKGDILATGGHDGQVRLWDCQRGFSLLNTFEFNSSVSCLTFSEVENSIWIGTDNGGVYMLSSPGSLGENHPAVLSGKCVY